MVNNAPNPPQFDLGDLELPADYSDSSFNPLEPSAVSLSGSYYMDVPNAGGGPVESDVAKTPITSFANWPERVDNISEELAVTDPDPTDSGGYTYDLEFEELEAEDYEEFRSDAESDVDGSPVSEGNVATSEPPPADPDPTEPPTNGPTLEELQDPVDEVDEFGGYAETVEDPLGRPAFEPSGSPGTGIINRTLGWFSLTIPMYGNP